MRALFVSGGGIGHGFPLVPLAWAMRVAGHEVRFVTTGRALDVEHAGLPVVDAAPGVDFTARIRERIAQSQETLQQTATMQNLCGAIPLLAQFSEVLVDGVVDAAMQWRPDLVVHTQADGAGLVAAGKLRVPLVDHGLGIVRGAGVHELLREHMADAFARHGVAELPQPIASIDVAPPSMLADESSGWPMRYVPYNGGCVLPNWLHRPGDRRRIAVTLGTVAPMTEGLGPLRQILQVAGSVDAEFVLALGNVDTSELGDLPDNAHVVGWVPLGELLRGCAALVHHGGEGTTMTALAAGVPQLILPSGRGRHIPAAAVQQCRAGLTSHVQDLDSAQLSRLLNDKKLAEAASRVREEIAALPTPADLVPRVVSLANSA
jgi:UDP:flavonoid glycosyltransferase YjiC (YdhE family)